MVLLFLAFILLSFVAAIWATCLVVFGYKLGPLLRITYSVGTIATIISTYFLTFHYAYFADLKTAIFGWPIPYVVYQKFENTSIWEDFVGPTWLLAYPMNFAIFQAIPSILVLVQFYRQRKAKPNLSGARR